MFSTAEMNQQEMNQQDCDRAIKSWEYPHESAGILGWSFDGKFINKMPSF